MLQGLMVKAVLLLSTLLAMFHCQGKESPALSSGSDAMEEQAAAAGITSNYINVNGIRMHYLSKGDGPLLVLLHGFPEHSGIWLEYIKELSLDFKVVAPDLRGYNLTEQPQGVDSYDVHLLAKDVAGLIQSLGATSAYLAGHDWGALLAWMVSDYHPEVVSKLVIMNGPHPAIYADLFKNDPDQREKAGYIDLLMSPGAETILGAFDFKMLQMSVFKTSSHEFTPAEKQGYVDAWRHGLSGPLNYYRYFIPRIDQIAAEMRGTKCPVLVLWGMADKNISENNLVGLDKYAPGVQIVRYPQASHWLTYEEQGPIVKEMRRFFRK